MVVLALDVADTLELLLPSPEVGEARQPVVTGVVTGKFGAVVQAGYHVGCQASALCRSNAQCLTWTVTLAGLLTSVVGSAVQIGAVPDCPPVITAMLAVGYATAFSKTGTNPPVWTPNARCPTAVKNPLIVPECAVMLIKVLGSSAKMALSCWRVRRACWGDCSS